jgi:hypothetical protein
MLRSPGPRLRGVPAAWRSAANSRSAMLLPPGRCVQRDPTEWPARVVPLLKRSEGMLPRPVELQSRDHAAR